MEKLLYDEKETCHVTGLGRSTLRKKWADGELVPVHVGRRVLWPADAVRRFVESLVAG